MLKLMKSLRCVKQINMKENSEENNVFMEVQNGRVTKVRNCYSQLSFQCQ